MLTIRQSYGVFHPKDVVNQPKMDQKYTFLNLLENLFSFVIYFF